MATKAKTEKTAREAGSTARAATWADAEPLSQTLARAFLDDPLLCFLLREEATRKAKLPRLFKLLFKLGLPLGGAGLPLTLAFFLGRAGLMTTKGCGFHTRLQKG